MANLLIHLVDIMGGHYVELKENANYIKEQLTLEEERFFKKQFLQELHYLMS